VKKEQGAVCEKKLMFQDGASNESPLNRWQTQSLDKVVPMMTCSSKKGGQS